MCTRRIIQTKYYVYINIYIKHNTLLLLIFVPILVYQLYHTFRYWKEGLEGDDMPDFCKGKDGKLDAEKWFDSHADVDEA